MQAISSIELNTVLENETYLLSAFRRGEEEAFKRIYDRLAKSLLYFVQNIIHSTTQDAEDIVATAFCKLCTEKVRTTLQSYDHIRRWMFVIVRNQCIDFLRAQRKNREVSQQLAYQEQQGTDTTELELLKMTLLQQLSEEIEKLPRQRKTIVRLYFFEHKTTAEIAESLQISAQTVLNHKTRALDSLRKTILRPEWLNLGTLLLALEATFFLMNL
jgi:RNA polymerase sigma-70 factor (ECF subfamily)